MIDAVRSARIDAPIIAMSNTSGVGLDEVREALAPRKTYCLLGSSGVGKTSLINTLLGKDVLRTNEVREHDGKGRHTTTRRQLIFLENGSMLIDTPGMRELALIGADTGIAESFGDIEMLSEDCRFKNCTHTAEAGCAVLQAIENGELDRDRYNGYMRIVKESQYHEMSYVEKRQKDRAFGRFIKTAKKSIKRNSPKR
jgi:ribosome biogenesis GTPase